MRKHQSQHDKSNWSRSVANRSELLDSPENTLSLDNRNSLIQQVSDNRVAQLATKITYGTPIDFTIGNKTDKVGTQMLAELDPNDPVKGSDTAGAEQAGIMEQLSRGNIKFVKGHLLNHDLGGRATVWNLFPITAHANSEHYHEVEKPIKHWIGKGNKVTYSVRAIAENALKNDNANGQFECDARVVSGPLALASPRIQKRITSVTSKQEYWREYKKKSNVKAKNKYSQIEYLSNNNVHRDEYGTITKNNRWNHYSGSTALNRLDNSFDRGKGLVHTSTGMVNSDKQNSLTKNQFIFPTLTTDLSSGDVVGDEELDDEGTQEALNEGATIVKITIPKFRRKSKGKLIRSKKHKEILSLKVRTRLKYERNKKYESILKQAVTGHLIDQGKISKGQKVSITRIGKNYSATIVTR